MSKITLIKAREILDSRGFPTIETVVFFDDRYASASVPSGVPIGKYEAVEIRDNDQRRFMGMGVVNAVNYVNSVLGPALVGMDVTAQNDIDKKLNGMDGTPNKSRYGVNSLLSISLAVAKAASFAQDIPPYIWFNKIAENNKLKTKISLPTPIFNVINGGRHGIGNLDFQEFQVIPASSKNFAQGLRICTEIYHNLKNVLKYRNAIHAVGDEGGFTPNLYTNLDALELIVESINKSRYRLQLDIFMGIDVAPSFFTVNGKYQIKDSQEAQTSDQFMEYLKQLHKNYHLLCLEDPLNNEAWGDWVKLTSMIGKEVYIIGDDLLATNMERLQKAIDEKTCN